ncbi:peptidyl-prolyl cis-trans isomerase FKBP19, chloroplastic-like [Cucurbita pepo subsp. pepo]|uniref:peptidyl-prolyl cis-trans isomerase FKBP19, chloroplastic-like n=1 Tax=Cucurbita pepo subsp. pepo TaxID=3664 RepID=UPI000C9D9EA2|nr:peptidyl-prolyl cis-trans isomerase FKBP19, chloroplastic-like [Cucurbita pepo subsp. pepo]XP_023527571.1 peptidyl-prolyl cis-trans isomerase FKBP19, chloroplastic-like [Cucurbita pepo subsp. pepo]
MASISATGSLLRFPTLRKSLNTSWSGPHFVHFPHDSHLSSSSGDSTEGCFKLVFDRRAVVFSSFGLLAGAFLKNADDGLAVASEFADMPALRGKDYGKTKMKYPDYTETESGLQYKDLRMGEGPSPKVGDTVVVDWDGYTIGYYGRIFEARNKTKGGSFEGDDKDFFKFRLGSQEVIQAFEEAVAGMALGGIRRIVVPPELGYPENDFNKKGPRPTTFSGQRALDFVLRNQGLIDKTLLFDIELLKVIPNSSV